MFLRKNRKRLGGELYEYWTLCETVRTERGPRQRAVASLGKLTGEDLAAGWDELEALLDGRKPPPRQPTDSADSTDQHGKTDSDPLQSVGLKFSVLRSPVLSTSSLTCSRSESAFHPWQNPVMVFGFRIQPSALSLTICSNPLNPWGKLGQDPLRSAEICGQVPVMALRFPHEMFCQFNQK